MTGDRVRISRDRRLRVDGDEFVVTGTRMSQPDNLGWGYSVEHVRTGMTVRDGYRTLADIREQIVSDVHAWRAGHGLSSRRHGLAWSVECSCGQTWELPDEAALHALLDEHELLRYR